MYIPWDWSYSCFVAFNHYSSPLFMLGFWNFWKFLRRAPSSVPMNARWRCTYFVSYFCSHLRCTRWMSAARSLIPALSFCFFRWHTQSELSSLYYVRMFNAVFFALFSSFVVFCCEWIRINTVVSRKKIIVAYQCVVVSPTFDGFLSWHCVFSLRMCRRLSDVLPLVAIVPIDTLRI